MIDAVSAAVLPFLAVAVPLFALIFVLGLAASAGLSGVMSSTADPATLTRQAQGVSVLFIVYQLLFMTSIGVLALYGLALVAQAKAGSQPSIGVGLSLAGRAILKFVVLGIIGAALGFVVGIIGAFAAGTTVGLLIAGLVSLAVGLGLWLCSAAVIVDLVNDAS